ncbi:MAG: tetratricopeptide repeat protein [Sphingobacteriaceae bacterium]|nr:tetratricopeptide repeat protein [Sphingobacteriaceae bacterium]
MQLVSDNFYSNKKQVLGILFLIPVLLYLKSVFYDFTPFDEQWLILKNKNVLADWSNINLIFSKPLAGMYYRPLLNVWLMLDFHIGGTSPFIYHLSSVVLHGLCVLLLYLILLELQVSKKLSFLFTLIFALHPIHLHAVAWVPGKNDLLLGFFALSALLFLLKYIQSKKLYFFIIHFFFFSASLFTKENAFLLIIPFSILINSQKKSTFLISLLLWTGVICLWYFIRQNIVNHYIPVHGELTNSIIKFIQGLFMAIGKSFLPYPQSVFPIINNFSVLTGIVITILLVILTLKNKLRNKRYGLTGLGIFICLIAIPLWYGANSSSGEHYEHRLYLPIIGLLIFLSQLNINFNHKNFIKAMYILLIVFGIKAFMRMDVYKSPLAFCESGIAENTQYFQFYFEKGNIMYDQKKFSEAIQNFNQALELQSRRPQILHNRANALLEVGKPEEAIADYNLAYEVSGKDPLILVSRCVAFNRIGKIPEAERDLKLLKQSCAQCIPPGLEENIKKNFDRYQFNVIQKLIKEEPGRAIYYVNRAKLYLDHKMPKEALADLQKACELEPENKEFQTYYHELNQSLPR